MCTGKYCFTTKALDVTVFTSRCSYLCLCLITLFLAVPAVITHDSLSSKRLHRFSVVQFQHPYTNMLVVGAMQTAVGVSQAGGSTCVLVAITYSALCIYHLEFI